ncbi:hypothetical protein ACFPFX_34815 [Streptomyces mauvecolor]|uniref:Uncharacterized protein n=1 Tax=Streptomyces mauvecolor TaxID=58345 RepID=A0ABV9UY47_9ACTN
MSVEVLGDHGVIGSPTPRPDYWEDAFMPLRTPRGRTTERNHIAGNLDELYSIVPLAGQLQSFGAGTVDQHRDQLLVRHRLCG